MSYAYEKVQDARFNKKVKNILAITEEVKKSGGLGNDDALGIELAQIASSIAKYREQKLNNPADKKLITLVEKDIKCLMNHLYKHGSEISKKITSSQNSQTLSEHFSSNDTIKAILKADDAGTHRKTCQIMLVNEVQYDNPILNHPNVLSQLAKKYGNEKNITGDLINFGMQFTSTIEDKVLLNEVCCSLSNVELLAQMMGWTE